jgi:hypothetical protein
LHLKHKADEADEREILVGCQGFLPPLILVVILAAQALIIAHQRQWKITIATTNVGHLSRLTTAQNW